MFHNDRTISVHLNSLPPLVLPSGAEALRLPAVRNNKPEDFAESSLPTRSAWLLLSLARHTSEVYGGCYPLVDC